MELNHWKEEKRLKDRYIKNYWEIYNYIVPNYKYLFKLFAEEDINTEDVDITKQCKLA